MVPVGDTGVFMAVECRVVGGSEKVSGVYDLGGLKMVWSEV